MIIVQGKVKAVIVVVVVGKFESGGSFRGWCLKSRETSKYNTGIKVYISILNNNHDEKEISLNLSLSPRGLTVILYKIVAQESWYTLVCCIYS